MRVAVVATRLLWACWQWSGLRAVLSSLAPAKENPLLRFVTISTLCSLLAVLVPVAGAEETSTAKPPIDAAGVEAPLPEMSEGAQELAAALAETSRRHGADSVALQASLLVAALKASATGATEVRVVGPSPAPDGDRLRIEVDTGIEFSSADSTDRERTDRIWEGLVVPVLEKMESFDIRPPGLELDFFYVVATPSAGVGERSRSRAVAFRFDPSVLADLASRTSEIAPYRLSAQIGDEAPDEGRRTPKPPIE